VPAMEALNVAIDAAGTTGAPTDVEGNGRSVGLYDEELDGVSTGTVRSASDESTDRRTCSCFDVEAFGTVDTTVMLVSEGGCNSGVSYPATE
jgi:hypothetical protein